MFADQTSILGIHSARWNSYMSSASTLEQVAEARIMLMTSATSNSTATAAAGLVIRLIDERTHYRLEVSTTRVAIVRHYYSVTPTYIGSVNMPLPANEWMNVSFSGKGRVFKAVINNVTVLTVTDVGSYSTWGAAGMFIAPYSVAQFDDFAIHGECDSGLVARNMREGMVATFQCKPGFEVVGNLTWQCFDNVQQYGPLSLTCKSKPPIPQQPTSFDLRERSANNSLVGSAFAMPANGDQVLTYQLISQSPFNSSRGLAFSVLSCSGLIRVIDPTQLDYQLSTSYNLTIFAWPDTQTIAGVYWNVTINIVNVPDAPVLADMDNISVAEGYVG
ncbi:MAG: hypothetical protein EOO65_06195, partial [Methanosarcinales archaeon]